MTTGIEEFIVMAFKGLLALLIAIVGWTLKTLKKDVDAIENDLQKVREDLPKTYLTKDDFRRFEDRVFPMLYRIEGKIDNKADKS